MHIITNLGVISLLIPTILSSSHYVLTDTQEQKSINLEIKNEDASFELLPWPFINIKNNINIFRQSFLDGCKQDYHISIKEDTFSQNVVEIHSEHFQPSEELLKKIDYLVQNYPKKVSFYGISLDGKISFGYNPDDKYSSASSIKAPFALYCYKQIEEGTSTFDETMTYTSKYYSTGTGVIKLGNQVQYTMEELLYNTIHYSDNIAYGMLYNYFGTEGYNKMLEELGCSYLQLTPYSQWGFASPREMALIWQEIYKYKETETGKNFLKLY